LERGPVPATDASATDSCCPPAQTMGKAQSQARYTAGDSSPAISCTYRWLSSWPFLVLPRLCVHTYSNNPLVLVVPISLWLLPIKQYQVNEDKKPLYSKVVVYALSSAPRVLLKFSFTVSHSICLGIGRVRHSNLTGFLRVEFLDFNLRLVASRTWYIQCYT
jgi:hypothetical protein